MFSEVLSLTRLVIVLQVQRDESLWSIGHLAVLVKFHNFSISNQFSVKAFQHYRKKKDINNICQNIAKYFVPSNSDAIPYLFWHRYLS